MMEKMEGISEQAMSELRASLAAVLRTDEEALDRAGRDETEDFLFRPEAVVEARSVQDVEVLMRWATAYGIPVTPAGALTGLSGGALPVRGGVALSLRRMNRVLEIDEVNQQVKVEPGVIVQELQEAVEARGLFYAVDPASKGSCTIGGNIAENSGGPRAVKYGVTADWVLNLQVVLADGTLITTGADTLKNATGYNLTQLLVGSEGTLGVIVGATLKLMPLPRFNALILAPFASARSACEAVGALFRAGQLPSAMEFMERRAVELAQSFSGENIWPAAPETEAFLLIEVDGANADSLVPQFEAIATVLEKHGAGELLYADDAAAKDRLWATRRKVGEAVKAHSIYKEVDTVVPRGRLPELIDAVNRIGDEFGFERVCYGHAGDGNLHINILKGDLGEYLWQNGLPKAIRALFVEVVRLGGTLSGEHGIGWVQRDYMDVAFKPPMLRLMREIKRLFDPTDILNPGKIFPDD